MRDPLCTDDTQAHTSLTQNMAGPAAGVTRGQLQKLQADLARAAGMGAQLARAAGWWGLESLLAQLSQRAASGARPELHQLMQARSHLHSGSRAPCQRGSAVVWTVDDILAARGRWWVVSWAELLVQARARACSKQEPKLLKLAQARIAQRPGRLVV